jgi:hypothetical protein
MLVAALKRTSTVLSSVGPALNVCGTIKVRTIDTEGNITMLLQIRILRSHIDLHWMNSRPNWLFGQTKKIFRKFYKSEKIRDLPLNITEYSSHKDDNNYYNQYSKIFIWLPATSGFSNKLIPMSPEKILLNWSPRRFWGIWRNRR